MTTRGEKPVPPGCDTQGGDWHAHRYRKGGQIGPQEGDRIHSSGAMKHTTQSRKQAAGRVGGADQACRLHSRLTSCGDGQADNEAIHTNTSDEPCKSGTRKGTGEKPAKHKPRFYAPQGAFLC